MDPDLDQRLSMWMGKAQDGDRKAYESLLSESARLLRVFLRKRWLEAEGAEDILQETLLSIHQGRHTYDRKRPFLAWMYAIARHRLIDFARRHRRRGEWERMGIREKNYGSAAAHSPVDLKPFEKLHWALKNLSSQQREVIQMLKFDGFSVKEIAKKTGKSESAVKVHAHRGYTQLRQLMKGPDED